MRNERSIQAVANSGFSKHFVKPLYDSYCFSRIPDTVLQLLTGESERPLPADVVGGSWDRPDVVVLFLIDGFGWEFFDGFSSKYPFLHRYESHGIASKITSQFPSTTAAHVTTINTGLEVGESGVYEWFYYEPLVDRMIAPLLFSYAGDHELNTLLESKISPVEFYPQRTLYQKLNERGVKSYVMQHEGIAHSPYSKSMFNGAENLPFLQLRNGLQKVVEICKKPQHQPTYIYLYFGDIDAMGHRHGISSVQFADAVDYCWKMFEECFLGPIQEVNKKIATIITADHGMVPVEPKRTFYLNKVFPDITESFKKNRAGMPLVPAGSCRDFFLHIEDGQLLSLKKQLEKQFDGVAEIYLTAELIKAGFFGSKAPSESLMNRIGNLVILPYEDQSIWWFHKHRFEQHFYAAHGGLTREEMESIFLFQTFGK